MQKGRPALVISDSKFLRRYDDYTLAAITSQVPENIMELEMLLDSNETNGLVKNSVLRLDFVMTIPAELISRKIGMLSDEQLKQVASKLKLHFGM